jgi:transcriptional regulator with XRE-family HTH domain
MEAEPLIEKLKDYKEKRGMTLHDLSMRLDVSVSTLERWFRTKRINRVYAKLVKEVFRI